MKCFDHKPIPVETVNTHHLGLQILARAHTWPTAWLIKAGLWLSKFSL